MIKFIKENIIHPLLEFAAQHFIRLIAAALGTLPIIYFLDAIKNWLLSSIHIQVYLILASAVLYVVVIYFCLKAYFTPKTKIINRIAVDKYGECYCPSCKGYLNIAQDPDHVGSKVFFCSKCNEIRLPYLENSKYIGAPEFHAFQKENPQTIYTSKIAQQRLNDSIKKTV